MIRGAVPGDEPAIRNCAKAAFAPYITRIGRKPAPMLADYAAQIAAGQVYVTEDESGAFQGFVAFYPRGEAMLLDIVAVQPEVAGRGVGKALITYCEDEACRQRLASVQLYTNAAMSENRTLYPHLGYVETGRRREDGFDRVYFEKKLR